MKKTWLKIWTSLKICCVIVLAVAAVTACKKPVSPPDNGGATNPEPAADSSYNPVDPTPPASIGFFADAWRAKSFHTPAQTQAGTAPAGTVTDSLVIDLNKILVKALPTLYGNNSNLWMGQIVTQPSLMQYLTDLQPNIIRAPAGSISDIYFWNGTDALPGPADAPDTLLNAAGEGSGTGYWYGGNNADWTLSLQHYYDLLAQTNSTGIITVNYGYARYGRSDDPVAAAAHLAADWVRHDNGRTKYWEVGNENFGDWEAGYRIDQSKNKDGQPEIITGTLYGKHFAVFADSMRAAALQTGTRIYIGAVLYNEQPASYTSTTVKTWNQGVLTASKDIPDYYVVHNYFTDYKANSTREEIMKTAKAVPAEMMAFIKSQIQAAGATIKPISLSEWNLFSSGSKQNVSFVAGMHAAETMGWLMKNGYGEASRWDLANGWDNGDDHGLFNIGDEPNAPKWNPRPAFYYMYYFQQFFGDRVVVDSFTTKSPDLVAFASSFSSGEAGTVIINRGNLNHVVAIDFDHFADAGDSYYWYVLQGGTGNGQFSGQVLVNGEGPATSTGGPLNYASIKAYKASLHGTINLAVPPMSVIYLVAAKKG